MLTREKLPTFWQKGRRDYQILYVAAGKAHFWFDGKEEVVKAGNMVLYKPGEIQKYVYYLADKPEVFWVHFTGNDVKKILEYHGIHLDDHVFYTGTLTEYKTLFRKIIRELQLCRYGYEDYTASLLNEILLLVSRQQRSESCAPGNIHAQVEDAAIYFSENYTFRHNVSYDDLGGTISPASNPDARLEENIFYVRDGVPFVRNHMDGGNYTESNDRIIPNEK